MMLGQFVQALEDARTSVKLDPSFVKGYVRVAKCCVALGEIHAARQVNKRLEIRFSTFFFKAKKIKHKKCVYALLSCTSE